ncbi:hypothetical protein [Amycolatopsis vastitatis]|uniref:DUF3592 domain-containing protein n=1 Tax=Amycolatopsis vastitatis TaxID=1905142 RepID=A0A229T478_9PSEU|nr:hypothetical protein [Amycolatopsis vastitatis]OXM66047.1 hypothetical protein CF165_22080 [Amycolatopsis vastitatis]
MIVLRIIGTVLWFAVPAGLLTYAIHDLVVRDAPTYSVEGTVSDHWQTHSSSSGPDPTTTTTYFVTIRASDGRDLELHDFRQELDTAPGTPVVAAVSRVTGEVVQLRRSGTPIDLRPPIGDDVTMIVFGGLGLFIALVRETALESVHWTGFVLGALSAGGGVYFALRLAG